MFIVERLHIPQRKLISGLQDVSTSEYQNLRSILISSNETFHVVCVIYVKCLYTVSNFCVVP